MGASRFDAVLLDAGGVLILPDPIAIGSVLDAWVGQRPIHRFHQAHYTGLDALESRALEGVTRTVETLDWTVYRRAYVASLGVGEGETDAAVAALARIWSPGLWRYRIEESFAALWRLAQRGVPIGIVSNANGQVEGTLAAEGVCQVGRGAGVPVVCVIDSHVAGVAKPDPAIFSPAVAALGGVDPALVAYVGDSYINDVEGASAAGLVPLHLDPYGLYGHLGHDRIASLHDLAELF